jgi:aminoglycoside phosphotransferase (APT) family kinase protein
MVNKINYHIFCEKMEAQKLGFLANLTQCSKIFLPSHATNVTVHHLRLLTHQGMSSEIYGFILSYSLQGSFHNDNLILRLYNKGFETTGFEEFTLLQVLKEQHFPVPNVYYYEDKDSILQKSFVIMEKIDGNPASKFLNDEPSALIIVDKMAEALHELHKLNPRCLRNFDSLKEKYDFDQERLLKLVAWIKRVPMSFFSFLTYYQKRFIRAVRSLEKLEPKKFQYAILHNDYEPNHVLFINDQYKIIDWHLAVVGGPSFDVANTYHELELLENSFKVHLGDYFVQCYEKHSGQRLANLQFNKTMSALRFASWFLLFPFEPNVFSVFTSLVKNSLFIEKVGYNLRKRYRQHSLNQQHSSGQKPLEYFQNYVVRSLENAVH